MHPAKRRDLRWAHDRDARRRAPPTLRPASLWHLCRAIMPSMRLASLALFALPCACSGAPAVANLPLLTRAPRPPRRRPWPQPPANPWLPTRRCLGRNAPRLRAGPGTLGLAPAPSQRRRRVPRSFHPATHLLQRSRVSSFHRRVAGTSDSTACSSESAAPRCSGFDVQLDRSRTQAHPSAAASFLSMASNRSIASALVARKTADSGVRLVSATYEEDVSSIAPSCVESHAATLLARVEVSSAPVGDGQARRCVPRPLLPCRVRRACPSDEAGRHGLGLCPAPGK